MQTIELMTQPTEGDSPLALAETEAALLAALADAIRVHGWILGATATAMIFQPWSTETTYRVEVTRLQVGS